MLSSVPQWVFMLQVYPFNLVIFMVPCDIQLDLDYLRICIYTGNSFPLYFPMYINVSASHLTEQLLICQLMFLGMEWHMLHCLVYVH